MRITAVCVILFLQAKGALSPSAITRLVLTFGLLGIELLLLAILGIIIVRKQLARKRDHIETYIATARQRTNQFNRINLTAFLLAVKSILTNVPMTVSPTLYWIAALNSNSQFSLSTALLVARILDLFTLLLMSSNVFVIAAASPKIRKEARLRLLNRQRPVSTWLTIGKRPSQKRQMDIAEKGDMSYTNEISATAAIDARDDAERSHSYNDAEKEISMELE